MAITLGNIVECIATKSTNYGKKAEVIAVYGDILECRYDNGELGKGNFKYYKLISSTSSSKESNLKQEVQTNKMEKFYQLKQDMHGLLAGAVLKQEESGKNYKPVDDMYFADDEKVSKAMESWSEKADIVENCPTWFERVYPKKSIKGMFYVSKAKLRELYAKGFVSATEEKEDTED